MGGGGGGGGGGGMGGGGGGGGFTVSQVTPETLLCCPDPLFLQSQCLVIVDRGMLQSKQFVFFATFCIARIAQRTSLNLSPLFDHAVVVQKSPGRFLCLGRDRSYQEADQVISIISLIPHSGRDLVVVAFSRALSFEKQQN